MRMFSLGQPRLHPCLKIEHGACAWVPPSAPAPCPLGRAGLRSPSLGGTGPSEDAEARTWDIQTAPCCHISPALLSVQLFRSANSVLLPWAVT